MGAGRTVLNNASPYERAGVIRYFYYIFLRESKLLMLISCNP